MSTRTHSPRGALALLTLALLPAAWLPCAQAAAPGAAPAAAPPAAQARFDASLAGLVDVDGKPLAANPWPGKRRIVFFGFTSCADVCPLTLLAVREAMKQLGPAAKDVVPVFVSVDPERDTPKQLRQYTQAFDPRIQGITGPQKRIEEVARAHGIFFEKRWVNVSANSYVFDHTATILVVDAQGSLLQSVSTAAPTPVVAQNIVRALKAR